MYFMQIKNNSAESLYIQIYSNLKDDISTAKLKGGERLPSLRSMASDLGVSITTVKLAYDQLMTEGYIESRPQSGFYVAGGAAALGGSRGAGSGIRDAKEHQPASDSQGEYITDPEAFDFAKWKKCMMAVLSDMPMKLLTPADRQGEIELREEIASYLYKSRSVICEPNQLVLGAGTQQLMGHLVRILRMLSIDYVSVEEPGYSPARKIFQDWGFGVKEIPVRSDGIEIEGLPVNVRGAVYVSPQNQFPTGALMPVSRRRQLLEWADKNDSFIIEDDYDSELRYTGLPVPALQGLDANGRVVYLGSFTSTLFPAVRISYMVLPPVMTEIYEGIKSNYDQTCSKTEQLTLAKFMHEGYYQANLRRIKKLYSRKLTKVVDAIEEFGVGLLSAENTQSGISLIVRLDTAARTIKEGTQGRERTEKLRKDLAERLVKSAAAAGVRMSSIDELGGDGCIYFTLYYNQIPQDRIRELVRDIVGRFRAGITRGSMDLPSVYEVIKLSGGRTV